MKNSRGLTLVEVMGTIVILVVISTACYVALNSGMRSWYVNNARVGLQQELRKAMDYMVDDLRQSGTSATAIDVLADDEWHTSVTFKKAVDIDSNKDIVWSGETFQYILGGIDSCQLQRVSDAGTVKVVAQDIASLLLRRQSTAPDLLEVVLRANNSTPYSGNIEANLKFKIKLRN